MRDSVPVEMDKTLATYLVHGFGNVTRIDYGTGHEMFFIGFLAALLIARLIPSEALFDVGTIVFAKYLNIVDKLIEKYRLEPAGSHGVWGLDDHFHIAYYWGASQLIGNRFPCMTMQSG